MSLWRTCAFLYLKAPQAESRDHHPSRPAPWSRAWSQHNTRLHELRFCQTNHWHNSTRNPNSSSISTLYKHTYITCLSLIWSMLKRILLVRAPVRCIYIINHTMEKRIIKFNMLHKKASFVLLEIKEPLSSVPPKFLREKRNINALAKYCKL